MKLDWFSADLGMAEVEEFTDEALELLSRRADSFLRGGGVLSWSEWRMASDATRAAFSDAGDAIRAEHAILTATAIRSPDMAQSYLDGDDPSDSIVHGWLKTQGDALEKKIRGGKA